MKELKEKRVGFPRKTVFSSSKLDLRVDLPTVEEALQILAAALCKAAEAGLDKDWDSAFAGRCYFSAELN